MIARKNCSIRDEKGAKGATCLVMIIMKIQTPAPH